MAGLSTTHYHSGSIELIGTHTAAAISGASISGRALSDVAHGSGAGLRYAELEMTSRRSTTERFFGGGFVDSTANLSDWIGANSQIGLYIGAGSPTEINIYQSGALIGGAGGSSNLIVGARIGLWVDCATRKVWFTTRPRNGWLVSNAEAARPDLGTSESWTVGGTDPIRIAITPGYGSGSDRNVVRFRSRHGELVNGELYGALPWDARTSTVSLVMRDESGAFIASGTDVEWAWFDETKPGALLAPTSRGSGTIGAAGVLTINVTTSLDPGGTGWAVVSTSSGTAGEQCRSHAMPTVAP